MTANPLLASSTPTQESPGAIVGDVAPTPAGVLLTGTQTLTTGDINPGDAGDASSLSDFAIEFWFKTSTTRPATDSHLIHGPLAFAAGPWQWDVVLKTTGAISFSVVTAASTTVNVTTGTLISYDPGLDSWYHIVGVVRSGAGVMELYLNGVLRSPSGGFATTIHPMATSPGNQAMVVGDAASALASAVYDEIATYRNGLEPARIAAHYAAGKQRGYNASITGYRVMQILDTIQSAAPRSFTSTGIYATTAAYMTGQPPLSEINRAVGAEGPDAFFFAAADGTLTFLDNAYRGTYAPWNTVQSTFGDGVGELGYVDVQIDYSGGSLVNEWNVTRSGEGAVTQTVSDATSISRYFKRSQSVSDVPVSDDGYANQIATYLLSKTKDPRLRISSISFSTLSPAVAEQIFRRELGDRIRVLRTPPGGGARIDQTLFIQKIEMSGANDGTPWQVQWAVSSL